MVVIVVVTGEEDCLYGVELFGKKIATDKQKTYYFIIIALFYFPFCLDSTRVIGPKIPVNATVAM